MKTDWFMVVQRISRFVQNAEIEWDEQSLLSIGPVEKEYCKGRKEAYESVSELIETELVEAQQRELKGDQCP